MANVDTNKIIIAGGGIRNIAPLALGTSTSETSFSYNSLVIGSTTPFASAPAIMPVSDQGAVPSQYDGGRPYLITAWGNIVTGTSTNITLKLYQVPFASLATLANGSVSGLNVLCASTARAVNSTTGKFFLQATLQWDSTTRLIHGQFTDQISNLLDSPAATTAVTTAVNSVAADLELNFIMSATSSSGNAANVVNLVEFGIQPL